MKKQIRNKGFYNAIQNKLNEESPDLAARLSLDDISVIMDTALRVMAELLKDGYRVIIEGYLSFFTKPIKRKCTNLQNKDTEETWYTLKRRIRIKPMDKFKKQVETELTTEEYNQYKLETNKKKSPTS